MIWNWELNFENFVVKVQYATMKSEINRKKVEVNSLKYVH